ncbi:MAG: DMT family transporter [Rhizobiales bacterium]|nr:DMT family transporter [Hyphomicrobiales bacterium]
MNLPASQAQRPLLAIGIMLIAMALLPFLDVIAKHLGDIGVPVIQIVWARMFFGTLLTLPIVVGQFGWKPVLTPNSPGIQVLRSLLLLTSTGLYFWSLKYLPVADALAIFFVQALAVTLLSPLMLGEHVGIRRWIATIVGFIGTLIIIRPGFQTFNLGIVLALGSGFATAVYMLLTRKIAGRAQAILTTLHTNAAGMVLVSIAVLFVWKSPTTEQWMLFVLLAMFATVGHYLIVRSFDYAEASMLAPFSYTEIIMAVFGGWYFFGDFPDKWTFIGVGILIASAVYTSYRERLRHIERIPEPAP